MSKGLDWTLIRSVAKDSARKVARNYPGIDADDIEQEILLKVTERQDTFVKQAYTVEALFSIFGKYGSEYANNERVAAYNFSDQYHYTTKEVRTLCGEALFDRDEFYAKVEQGDAKISAEFDEVMARVVDLQAAFSELSDNEKAVIRKRFLLGESLANAETKALQRAVDRLALKINVGRSKRRSAHEGPGSRKAISNAQAGVITHSDRDGN